MLYEALKPWLFSLDAERVHEEVSGLMGLAAHVPGADKVLSLLTGNGGRNLEKTVFGIKFSNPVGLAAGFDKDGKLISILPGLGFGFLEIGSVTLEPQPGNVKPRLFRLVEQGAILNRMGFNSEGARAVALRLSNSPLPSVPLGINLGLNKGTPADKAAKAYAQTFKLLAKYGDYFVINVSSPNTPGLRDLQTATNLADILNTVQDANPGRKPVLVKLSPDLAGEDLDACVDIAGRTAQGLVVSNTTISRENVPEPFKSEAGGLSGRPLKILSTELVRKVRSMTTLPIIGVGGIETPEDARERLDAGADLVQLYTGLIYGGPRTAKNITRGLAAAR
ncbi:MAG: quinone-dependent dihydroorotate dehydrogenase [Elusimicrobia bacterium]|nr:quinone-dependent dihydroorotate dehydrogenase [Elusimicrobiota bacterium]